VFVSIALVLAGIGARAETGANGSLRVTASWGDDRLVAGWAAQAALSRDGRRLAAATVNGVIIWDVGGGAEVRIPMAATTWTVPLLAFGQGDRVLLTARDGDLAAWDVATGRKLAGVKPTGFERPAVALGPGTSLAVVWDSGEPETFRLEIWDVERAVRVQTIAAPEGHPIGPETYAFVGAGRRLFRVRSHPQYNGAPDVEEQSLWNVGDGKLVYRDRTNSGCGGDACAPVAAELAPDGRTLVRTFATVVAAGGRGERTAGNGRTEWRIELTDLDTARHTVLEQPAGGSLGFSLAGDGRTLASFATQPGEIAIRELGRLARRTFKLAETGASRLLLSSAGKLLLVGGDANRERWLSLYRTSDGRRLWHDPHVPRPDRVEPKYEIDDAAGLVLCTRFCPPPDGTRTVAWDAGSGKRAFDLPNSNGLGVWFSTQRGPLFPIHAGFDLRAPAAPWASLLPAGRRVGVITRLAVSRDGKWLAEAGSDGLLQIRSLAEPSVVIALPEQDTVEDLKFLPDRDQLAVAYRGRAALWDPARRQVVAEARTGKGGTFSRLFAGGHRVAFDVYQHAIELRSLDDPRAMELLQRPCGARMPSLPAIDFDGTGLCVASDSGDVDTLRALRGGAVRARLGKQESSALALTVSRDGSHALVSHYRGGAALVSLRGAGRVLPLGGMDAMTEALAFSPDGRRAVTGSVDGVLRLWNARTGALLDSISLADRIDQPTAIAPAPDGRTLFVGTARGLILRLEMADQ